MTTTTAARFEVLTAKTLGPVDVTADTVRAPAASLFDTLVLQDECGSCDGAGCVECEQTGIALTAYAIDDADQIVHAYRSERSMEREGVTICGRQTESCTPYMATTEQKTHADCVVCNRRIQAAMKSGQVRL